MKHSILSFHIISYILINAIPKINCQLSPTPDITSHHGFSTTQSPHTKKNENNSVQPSLEMSNSFPFRICGAPSTGHLFRFPLEHTCPITEDKEHKEGILLIFKRNIIPHIFKVRKYRKTVTSTTVYSGFFDSSITNQYTNSFSVPQHEIHHMDTTYQCFSAVEVIINGEKNVYTDRDDVNNTVFLQPVDGLTENIRRYSSQPKLYTVPGWFPGIYRTRTTVSCEIVDMVASATDPFHYFFTSMGDTVEMSPFWSGPESSGQQTEVMKEKLSSVSVLQNYTLISYGKMGQPHTPETRIFVDKNQYTLSWKHEPRKKAHCPLVFWKGYTQGIQTTHEKTHHFVANEETASFTTSKTQHTEFQTKFSCLMSEINKTLEEKLAKLNATHTKLGDVEFYSTNGGLYIVWQPVIPLSLLNAKMAADGVSKPTPPSITTPKHNARQRRNVEEISSTPSPVVNSGVGEDITDAEKTVIAAQIQFAYDKLRTSINNILEDLTRTWCRDQHRASMMWYELSKISPTSVMTSLYGKPVAAKWLGDVISVSDCITVDQSSVFIHKSLRVHGSTTTCYSRPLVTFKFINGTTVFRGQLGTRNEIMLTTSLIENCLDNTEYYFQAGNQTHIYKNYLHSETISSDKIPTLETIIALNLSFIENIDFKTIELYSKDEKRLANVFDIETMFRQYNYYTQRISGLRRDLDNTIENNRDSVIRTFGSLVEDLGVVGKTIVNTVSSVVTFFGAIVTGFISFIKNPFGGMFMIILIVGAIVLIFLLSKKTKQMYEAPVKMFYPNIDKIIKDQNVKPISDEHLQNILVAMHNMQQTQLHEANTKGPDESKIKNVFHNVSDTLRRRKSGYKPLTQEEDMPDIDDTFV
uniref:Glycoprotein B n=1 Tax=Myotis ricketti herpesvirus 1 TaxID=1200670 RepID=I6UAT3_9GAMA|nr:glycoprotein B [Myotis ricketti herpesvirus 1]